MSLTSLFLESSDNQRVNNQLSIVRMHMARSIITWFHPITPVKVLANVFPYISLNNKLTPRMVRPKLRNIKHKIV